MPGPQVKPEDIANRALDMLGANSIAEFQEGSPEANAALRHYGATIRDILRSAPWNFARKAQKLVLAKDRTNTDGTVPTSVPAPWIYEYLYPDDCVKVRFIPALNAQQIDEEPPLMSGMPIAPTVSSMTPAAFVIGMDLWNPDPEFGNTGGISVILTNIRDACLVYTSAVMDPQLWDALFAEAVVATLGAKLALAVVDDKKLALEMRSQQIQIAKDMVGQARVANGDESWTTTDHLPDWLRVRGFGGWPFGFWNSNVPGGGIGCGWDSIYFPDGSAY